MAHFTQRLTNFIRRQLLKSSRYRWYVFTPEVSRETMAPLMGLYTTFAAGGEYRERTAEGQERRVAQSTLDKRRALKAKRVVYVCDGRTIAGGLADRFKGILSLYAISEELGYDFRICFTSPFTLSNYLVPAGEHDWRISPDELYREDAAMLVLENTEDSDYQTRRQYAWLRRRLEEGPAEMHVITNSNYAYSLDYSALFRRLFRPSPTLEAALEAEGQRLGRYVSVSARFLSMLGDFRETGANVALPEAEAENLMAHCISEIERLHERHPEHNILVGTDSMRFLERASRLPYVRIVEGRVAHTDLMDHTGEGRLHEKLFLDFLLIARAESIYLLHTPPMRISGFPYAASRISGSPFNILEF